MSYWHRIDEDTIVTAKRNPATITRTSLWTAKLQSSHCTVYAHANTRKKAVHAVGIRLAKLLSTFLNAPLNTKVKKK